MLLALGVAISNADWRERVGEAGGERSFSSVAVSISSPAGGGRTIVSAAAEHLRGGGNGRESQPLCVAVWGPSQLVHRGGKEEQQPGVASRLPLPGQVGLGHWCMARVWLREQIGQTGPATGHLGATWPNPHQFLHSLSLLEEYARSIVLEQENRRIEEPIAGTSPGWTEMMTEVADFPSLDCAFGLRYLAATIHMFLELRMDSARQGKRSSGSSGRNAMGREWMASWASLGARWKSNQGDSPTGKTC